MAKFKFFSSSKSQATGSEPSTDAVAFSSNKPAEKPESDEFDFLADEPETTDQTDDENQGDNSSLVQKIETRISHNLHIFSTARYKFYKLFLGPQTDYRKLSWWIGTGYNLIFVLLALVNIAPLVTDLSSHDQFGAFLKYNYVLIFIFASDYFFRLIFSDCFYKGRFRLWKALVLHFLNFFMVIDLVSWLLALLSVIFGWNTEKNNYIIISIFLLLKSLSGFRLLMNYSQNYKRWQILFLVIRKNKKFIFLLIVAFLFITFIFAILVYNASIFSAELEEFKGQRKVNNFFDAFWLSFLTITTIGYGDVFPTTFSGRIVIIFLSIFGISFYSLLTTLMVNIYNKYINTVKRYYKKIGKKVESDEEIDL
ncbi:voltage-gated potassium channel Kch [Mycoplasmoides fastidiosum]|uniref:Voltage-gated potassium channel Kch n=1 Tax=Mycoplasmoides fastidiosum TaxID=92758 RepID=A0ABU0LZB1_9BACT|nr:ion transporter [Mycoplasmoides fastidiosum]MDQ0514019.1 voltage-gated potassium channel Kch [Mycoplasmoides fastidiosum]UUD37571.1 ion transporter [Mycoplasmoides fastidiosum]